MACTSDIRTGKHVEYRNKECHDMNTESIEISRWLRAGIVGIALSLATVQTAGADTLRPTVDTGGPGGGTSSAEVYYELEYEQGRPIVIEQVDSQSASQAAVEAAGREARTWPNDDSTSIVVQQPIVSALEGGPYAIGNASVPEQAAVEAAGREARTWPNYDSTSIVVQQPNTSMLEGGYYVVVDEQGIAYSPEKKPVDVGLAVSPVQEHRAVFHAPEGASYAVVDEHGNAFIAEGASSVDEVQAASGVNQELRSIQRIEGNDVANDSTAPAFAVQPNLRSIQLIEGKQAVAEVARPASASAYSVCLACSTLG
jgi:hypothetical protein